MCDQTMSIPGLLQVYPRSIPGTLYARQEYTQVGTKFFIHKILIHYLIVEKLYHFQIHMVVYQLINWRFNSSSLIHPIVLTVSSVFSIQLHTVGVCFYGWDSHNGVFDSSSGLMRLIMTQKHTFKLTSQAKLRICVHKNGWKTFLLRKCKSFTKSICCEAPDAMARALKHFSHFCLHIEEGDVISTGVTGCFFIQKCNFAAGEALHPPCGTKDKWMTYTSTSRPTIMNNTE